MSDQTDSGSVPGGRDIAEADWERLSQFLDGDLADEDARQLERELALDPALQAALDDLQRMTVALRTVERAPAGFASRVMAAVENEPIPANRPWRFPLQGLAVAVAAAVALILAIPRGGGDPEAGAAKIDLQDVIAGIPSDPEAAAAPVQELKVEQAKSAARPGRPYAVVGEPGVESKVGGGEIPGGTETVAPAGDAAATRPAPVGYATEYQYQVAQVTQAELGNLAARFGGGLQDAAGAPVSLDSLGGGAGVVYLSVPSDRVGEFDVAMRRLGKRTGGPSGESIPRAGEPLRVVITVDSIR